MPPLSRDQLDMMEDLLFPSSPQQSSSEEESQQQHCKMTPFTMMKKVSSLSSLEDASPPTQTKKMKKQMKRRRNVCFSSEEPTVYVIPNASDELTPEEFESVYLLRDDLRRIKRDMLHTLEIMKKGDGAPRLVDNDECCYRGLECHLPMAKRDRYQRVSRVLQAVLDEQDISGSISSHWVHTKYNELTSFSEEKAIMMGLIDEDAAVAAQYNDDDDFDNDDIAVAA